MTCKGDVYVDSEIGVLKTVFLHRPGRELKCVTIENKDEFLIDEIVWAERAAQNHDEFAALLRANGAEVVYFQDCLADVLKESSVRSSLLDELLRFEAIDRDLAEALKKTVMEMTAHEASAVIVGGMTKHEARERMGDIKSLAYAAADEFSFFFKPLPNLYFQRDSYFFIRNAVVLCAMRYPARRRESLCARYICRHHQLFDGTRILFGADMNDRFPDAIEGGDVLVLNEDCVAIGISQRSNSGTIQNVGSRLAGIGIKKVLAVDIPKKRAYMHLDTVFTMVDRDAFTIYPGVADDMRVWELDYEGDGRLVKIRESCDLFGCLRKNLGLEKIRRIDTGGGDLVEALRDQWNDGTNTLAIAPGVVVAYESNVVSNIALRDAGITVHEVNGSELGKGRGGPRCMSMPLKRESLL